MKISRPASHIVATFLFCVMALAFGLSVRSELSKSTASAIRQAIFVIPYLVAVIALLRPPAKWAYYLFSALLFAFPVFIVLAEIGRASWRDRGCQSVCIVV